MRMTLEQFMEVEAKAKGRPMKPRKPRACRTEHDEQAEVIQWAEHVKPRVPVLRWLHAIPNGGARAKAVAVKEEHDGTTDEARHRWTGNDGLREVQSGLDG